MTRLNRKPKQAGVRRLPIGNTKLRLCVVLPSSVSRFETSPQNCETQKPVSPKNPRSEGRRACAGWAQAGGAEPGLGLGGGAGGGENGARAVFLYLPRRSRVGGHIKKQEECHAGMCGSV